MAGPLGWTACSGVVTMETGTCYFHTSLVIILKNGGAKQTHSRHDRPDQNVLFYFLNLQ